MGVTVSKLAVLVFIFVAPTLAGAFVVALLAVDQALASGAAIALVAGLGAALAAPASWLIARAIRRETEKGSPAR